MRTPAFFLALVLVLAGCASGDEATLPEPPQPTQPAAPNTGFLAFVPVGGRPTIYMPSSDDHLAVVDAAAPHGSSGLVGTVELGAFTQAVGADGDDVVAVDSDGPVVHFASAASGTSRGTAELPLGSETFLVSGNAVYSSGVAVDSARRRAWVSTSTGLVEYDLDTREVTASFAAPPTENFAYDRVARALYAPFYLCDPANTSECVPFAQPGGPDLTDSLTVVDLVSGGRVYSLVSASAVDPHAPMGFEVDAVAIDETLRAAAVIVEDPPALHVLDLGSIQYDLTTCSVPTAVAVPLPAGKYSAVTVDPSTHLALVAQESGGGVAFVDVAGALQGATSALVLSMPDLPSGAPWITRADPHGVTVGVVAGRPCAFLASEDRNWIARVDLLSVLGLTVQSAGAGAFAAAVSYVGAAPPP